MSVREAVDLFAGPGGWDVAARELGIETIGIEWDKAACDTRRAAGLTTIQADVRTINPLHPSLLTKGLIASPSCQSFSPAGNGKGRKQLDLVLEGLNRVVAGLPLPEYDDDRTAMTLEPMRWIKERYDAGYPYEWIAFEQVRSVLPVWQAYSVHLQAMGYYVETGVLSAEEFGVPQTRKRAILVARYQAPVSLPAPTHMKYKKGIPQDYTENGLLPWVSMADALSDNTPRSLRSNYGTGGDPKNRGMRDINEPAPTVTSKVDRNKWVPNTAVPGDTEWVHNRPSPTIVGSFAPDVVAAPGWRKAGDGPRQSQPGSVRVTPEEAGVLQAFPEGYPWSGSKTKIGEQIGNCIPPLLAHHILRGVAT